MNNQITKPEILNKLEELIKSVDELLVKSTDSEQTQFHIDVCKNKLIELYNNISAYENELKSATFVKEEIVFDTEKQETEQPSIVVNDESVETEPEPEIHDKKNIPETTVYQTETKDTVETQDIIQESEINEVILQESEKDETEKSAEAGKKTISDRFQTDSGSLNQRFQDTQANNSISNRIQANPVHDLKKAIGINDRFSFINELFEGDKGMYDSFLDKICSLNTSEEVISIFHEESQQRKWTEKAAFNKMHDLIQRFAITK
jgi:hypothetical protein